ncbi:Ankyrin repeat protein (14), partial [Monkeypox virus]
MVNDKILY